MKWQMAFICDVCDKRIDKNMITIQQFHTCHSQCYQSLPEGCACNNESKCPCYHGGLCRCNATCGCSCVERYIEKIGDAHCLGCASGTDASSSHTCR